MQDFFLSHCISGIVKPASNILYKYEYEYKIYVPYMIQTGFCN